jgi:hypothetical protein
MLLMLIRRTSVQDEAKRREDTDVIDKSRKEYVCNLLQALDDDIQTLSITKDRP